MMDAGDVCDNLGDGHLVTRMMHWRLATSLPEGMSLSPIVAAIAGSIAELGQMNLATGWTSFFQTLLKIIKCWSLWKRDACVIVSQQKCLIWGKANTPPIWQGIPPFGTPHHYDMTAHNFLVFLEYDLFAMRNLNLIRLAKRSINGGGGIDCHCPRLGMHPHLLPPHVCVSRLPINPTTHWLPTSYRFHWSIQMWILFFTSTPTDNKGQNWHNCPFCRFCRVLSVVVRFKT